MGKDLDRRSALLGAAVALGATAMLAFGLGAGAVGSGDRIVTWGSDGKQAYLWRIEGDRLVFLDEGRADKGRGDERDDDEDKVKNKDKGRNDDEGERDDVGQPGKPGEKGKPAEKGRGKGGG